MCIITEIGDIMGRITFKGFRKLAEQNRLTSYTIKVNSDIKISQSTWKRLKEDKDGVTTNTLAQLCELFNCQPGDLMEYEKDAE